MRNPQKTNKGISTLKEKIELYYSIKSKKNKNLRDLITIKSNSNTTKRDIVMSIISSSTEYHRIR